MDENNFDYTDVDSYIDKFNDDTDLDWHTETFDD